MMPPEPALLARVCTRPSGSELPASRAALRLWSRWLPGWIVRHVRASTDFVVVAGVVDQLLAVLVINAAGEDVWDLRW